MKLAMGLSGGDKHESDDKALATVTSGIEFGFVINSAHISALTLTRQILHPYLSER